MVMKALLISSIYFPDIGGPATYIPALADYLERNGCNVTVISLTDDITYVRPDENWDRFFIDRKQNKFLRTFRLIRLIRKSAKGVDYVFANGLVLETAIAIQNLEIASTVKIVGDYVWEWASNNKLTSHSLEEFSNQKISWKFLPRRKIFNWAITNFDHITTPSQNLAQCMHLWGIDRDIEVIQNGVKCFDSSNIEKTYDVVSLSRLVPWKRIELLIEACAKANLSLAIAGDGPEREVLENLAIKLGCKAHFLGQLSPVDCRILLEKSNVFALISSYEGLSFSLIEAMMLEKRILVSPNSGNLAVINHDIEGKVLMNIDPNEIAETLTFLNSSDPLALAMAAKAREKARTMFCAEKQLLKMFELIRN